MIPNDSHRKKLVNLHLDLHRYYRELHTPCFRTEAEIRELEALRDTIRQQMSWFQKHVAVEGSGLGDLFDCPKGHDFLHMVEALRELGWILHASTGIWEATNRSLKLTDTRTRQDKMEGTHNDALLQQQGNAAPNAPSPRALTDAQAHVDLPASL